MSAVALGTAWLRAGRSSQVLVVGPSLGTSAAQLWQPVVDQLPVELSVLAWDLPGHADTPIGGPFTMGDLAAGVLAVVDEHAGAEIPFAYAGDSVGGAVGLQLQLDAPTRIDSAALRVYPRGRRLKSGRRDGSKSAHTVVPDLHMDVRHTLSWAEQMTG